MRYDLHIHTEYCGHAPGMTVEAICAGAAERKLETIAITDHIYGPQSVSVLEKIRQDVRACRGGLEVIVGAEVDVDGDFADGRLVCDVPEGADYVIAGVHYVPTVGNYPWRPEQNNLEAGTFMRYWKSTLLGVASNPKVHTLAHPGRLLAAALGPAVDWAAAMEVFGQAAGLSEKNGIAWEINELTGDRLSPELKGKWHQIYEVALQAGVKLVYGSDAHEPAAMGKFVFAEYILSKLPSGSLSTLREILEWKKGLA